MTDSALSAVLAVVGGVALIVLGFVPWVAVQYRRRGGAAFGQGVLAASAIVYALAILTYTLLPLPADPQAVCSAGGAAPQLHPLAFVGDIAKNGGITGPHSLLSNPAAAQVLFNVVLFVPLGMLVGHALRRLPWAAATLLATAAGFGVSLFVEFTQLTGNWFLYPCAYRLFDVDDLIANTAGALAGAIAAPALLVFAGRRAALRAGDPRPVGRARRLLGMLCDVLAVVLTQAALSTVLLVAAGVGGDRRESVWFDLAQGTAVLLPALAQLVLIAATGRTLGEGVVRLEPSVRPGFWRGVVRWLFGIGGWALLSLDESDTSAAGALALVAVIAVFVTRRHRGLAYAITRLELRDEREADAAASAHENSGAGGAPGSR